MFYIEIAKMSTKRSTVQKAFPWEQYKELPILQEAMAILPANYEFEIHLKKLKSNLIKLTKHYTSIQVFAKFYNNVNEFTGCGSLAFISLSYHA